MLARLNAGVATVPQTALHAALRSRPLSGEQTAMVRRLVTSGAGVEVVVGKAGSGKTFALAAAREAWDAAGVPVVGCALSARAALELQRGALIRSMTLHRLLADLDHPKHGGLAPGSVVVVDEAAMVGTRMLARLLAHAALADAKVVLVGDHHQLPEIDAGGAFAALTTRLPTIELNGNRRQAEPWEREALDQLRQGDPSSAVNAYRQQDRIQVGETDEDLRKQLVGDWYEAAFEQGRDAVMLARCHGDVADLNRRARRLLAAASELHGPTLDICGRAFQAGDRAVCLRNDHRNGVTNGSRGTVIAVHPQRQSLDFLPDGASRVVTLRPSYLVHGWLDHGYALTAHKAQGLTCDATFVLTDEGLYREWAYVALSRGRQENHLYIVDEAAHADAHTHPTTLRPDQRESLDQLTARLERLARQRLGVDHLDDHTRAIIDNVLAAAQQRQRTHECGLELHRGLAIEM